MSQVWPLEQHRVWYGLLVAVQAVAERFSQHCYIYKQVGRALHLHVYGELGEIGGGCKVEGFHRQRGDCGRRAAGMCMTSIGSFWGFI